MSMKEKSMGRCKEEIALNRKHGMTSVDIERFLRDNGRHIRAIVGPFQDSGDYKNLLSEAYLGALKGLQTYDPNKDLKLIQYVCACASNEVRMCIRRKYARPEKTWI